MTISRDELDAVVRDLKDAIAQNRVELRITFQRIAQMQVELDRLRNGRASRKKSAPLSLTAAADEGR